MRVVGKESLQECGQLADAAGALNATAFGPLEGEISQESAQQLIHR